MYLSSAKERCVVLGLYIVENNATVRATATRFGISKSTVHKDVTQTLKNTNRSLYLDVKSVLEKNKVERHLRGGEATKQKYKCETNKQKDKDKKDKAIY
ncbi:MAG: stage III sporulation protein D [Ruminococcaceae bacterium]|nr:stage III sporulation protein D [Oscillospiraceae bacterium]